MIRRILYMIPIAAAMMALGPSSATGLSDVYKNNIYDTGILKPTDSGPPIETGEAAPGFTLPAISGDKVSLYNYRGKKNVVISFVPAAWTPVCSDQWPGYKIAKPIFDQYDAILLGITVDNIPTLHAWTNQMGDLWFPVLSDFWPHGAAANSYGVLRSDGMAERAIFVIDKKGIIRRVEVSDINVRPRLESIVEALAEIEGRK